MTSSTSASSLFPLAASNVQPFVPRSKLQQADDVDDEAEEHAAEEDEEDDEEEEEMHEEEEVDAPVHHSFLSGNAIDISSLVAVPAYGGLSSPNTGLGITAICMDPTREVLWSGSEAVLLLVTVFEILYFSSSWPACLVLSCRISGTIECLLVP